MEIAKVEEEELTDTQKVYQEVRAIRALLEAERARQKGIWDVVWHVFGLFKSEVTKLLKGDEQS